MKTDPISPAFGHTALDIVGDEMIGSSQYPGLSKREYMAVMCLNGILSHHKSWSSLRNAAEVAVWAADELINELNQRETEHPTEPTALAPSSGDPLATVKWDLSSQAAALAACIERIDELERRLDSLIAQIHEGLED